MKEDEDGFSYRAIGMAMECHRELGPGLSELFYHELLRRKLMAAGIRHQFKPTGQLFHREMLVDQFEADLIIGDDLDLELKALWGTFAPEHLLQIICYLKFWRLRAGLLIDFGKESLVVRRIQYTTPEVSFDAHAFVQLAPPFVSDRKRLNELAVAIGNVLALHGLGYRDTTYRGLMFAELKSNGVDVLSDPTARILPPGGCVLGETKLRCLVVAGCCALLVTALRESHQAADRAVLQTYLRHLGLAWGVTLNFGKRQLQTQFVCAPKRAN
jgi:GxxExxY protein